MEATVDIVIIGLNSARTLEACIDSVRRSHYSQDQITIYYVDGGSTDGSPDIARSKGVEVVSYSSALPAPGDQRNAGWRAGRGWAVQFLDSDTVMDADWLPVAVPRLSDGVGAVNGNRREMFPEATVFNWIGDQEWNGPEGDAHEFGGDVLIRREALERTEGYDSSLVGGEDPELAYRVRQAGYRLWKLDVSMTLHDLGMKTIRQYWRRAFRSGHAYAEVHHRHHDFWASEVRRILVRGGVFMGGWLLLAATFWSPWFFVSPLVGTFLLCLPRWRSVGSFRARGMSEKQAKLYAWHASLVIIPQFFGALRYQAGRWTARPMTNRRLKTRPNAS
jgi:glycosyltransferase involved in cell wall biosynthesis